MLSKKPYTKPVGSGEGIKIACYDSADKCITGYIDYEDILKYKYNTEILRNWLSKAWYKETKEGKLRVSKYVQSI